MAIIYREFSIGVSAEKVWSAVRDVGAVHKRLAIGFVTDVQLEDDSRIVTFANGFSVREQIVGVDEHKRRLAYAAVGGRAEHHNASIQVFAEGESRSRILWITDLLPDEVAGPIGEMIEEGIKAMKRTLER